MQKHPVFFTSTSDFRKWFIENHLTESEIIVGFYKVSTCKPSIKWSESVDVALCFGWIDGIRKSIDSESYLIRFTPRNPKSIWSKINIEKVEALIKANLMTQKGLEAFEKRTNEKSGIYSFENDSRQLPDEYIEILKTDTKAFTFYEQLAPSYKKTYSHWILSAKQEKTQLSRLQKMITACSDNKKLF